MHYVVIALICVGLYLYLSAFFNKSRGAAYKQPAQMIIGALLSIVAVIIFLKGNIAFAGLLAAGALAAFGGKFFGASSPEENASNKPHYKAEMTRAEAIEILGLNANPTAEEIKLAHKKLMLKLHPDQGGNDYLAQRINQAKDLLLNDL